jgi:tetratricopeptide (TPR) repeat protein
MTAAARVSTVALILNSLAAIGCGTSAEDYVARARAFAKDGKHSEAIVEFQRAIQENDRNGEAYYRLAQSSEQIQDFSNAAKNYIVAGRLLPTTVEAQIQAASMLLLGRRFEEALVCAERAVSLDPRNVRAQILRAHSLSGLKRTGEALASIQRAISLDPTRGDTYADFGVFQFATGSIEQGEENLKKAAQSTPPSIPAQMTLASLYWAQGRLDDAEHYLKRAVVTEPDNVRASRALATFYLGNNRAAEAEQHLKAVADKSKALTARLALADYYIVSSREADATRILDAAAAEKTGYAEARSRLAALRYQSNTSAAHKLIDETIAVQPQSSRALLTKANFLLVERKPDQALTLLRAAVEADPRSVPAHYALATFFAASQDLAAAASEFNQILEIDPQSVPARMELARLNLAAGNAGVAGQFASQAVEARPSLDASLLYARTLVAKGEISRAEAVLRPFLGTTTRADVLSLAGSVYIGIGESARGRQLFEQALRLNPGDDEPLESLVRMDLAVGNIARARTLAEAHLSRRPRDPQLLILAARTYGAGGDVDRMVAALRAAIQNDPASTTAYALLGQVFAAQGKLADALAEYERVIGRDPQSVSAHTMTAFLLENLGRTAEAEKRYKRVLELDARAAVAANNLAWIVTERGGNLDEALQLVQVAKDVLPESPDVNDTLAWIYYRKNLPEMALPPLRLALERAPTNAVYHYHAGLVYMKTGDIDSARTSLQTALKIDANFSGAKAAREVLSRLQ